MAAGADGVAVISAILDATDVVRAVYELRTAIGL
jgi:thiamine monophosphate synthase